jgi:hypothetical protein
LGNSVPLAHRHGHVATVAVFAHHHQLKLHRRRFQHDDFDRFDVCEDASGRAESISTTTHRPRRGSVAAVLRADDRHANQGYQQKEANDLTHLAFLQVH